MKTEKYRLIENFNPDDSKVKPSTELSELIKSLTSNEKRYFRMYVSLQKGSKNYIKLFDVIESQKIYDENIIRKKYGREGFAKNLAYTKNYLYKLIFKSLNSYREEKSVDTKLNNILNQCRILFDKSLIRQYFRTLQSGKKSALKNERFSYALEFLELERQLTKKEELSGHNIESIFHEKNEILEKIKLINKFKRAVNQLFKIQRIKGIVRDAESASEIEKILSPLDIIKEKKSMTVSSLESYYFAASLAFDLKNETEKSYSSIKLRNRIIVSNPEIFKQSLFDNHKDSYLMMILSASNAGKYREAETLLKKYKKLYGRKDQELSIHFTETELNLNYSTAKEDVKYYEKHKSDTEKILIKYRSKMTVNTHNYLFFKLAKYYFVTENYNDALRTINLFFESGYLKYSRFIEPYVRMLNVLIHYELGNKQLLGYLISSTVKYLKSKNKYYETEATVLKFLQSILRLNNEEEIRKKLYIARKNFTELKSKEFERNAFVYIDYLNWLLKKL